VRISASFFSIFPAQVDFRKQVPAERPLRAELIAMRSGNAAMRAQCALTTHFDGHNGKFL
jgi:hypothetical protein